MMHNATGMDSAHDEEQASFDRLLQDVARLRVPGLDPARLPQLGEVVEEKYRVEELIGMGGMGAVYRATHTTTGKEVALKWLLPSVSGATARFLREARAMARIDHPHVVDVYDVGDYRGAPYLVMELLRGVSLRTRLGAGRISPVELSSIMIPALRGVAAAHARGVIHRDLKPDNVFLCRGPDGVPRGSKVLDFGISKLCANDDCGMTLTKDGASLGTPAYMSLEQLEDPLKVDERTDIYAAGVIMYEALTGVLPFRAGSPAALVLALIRQRPVPVRSLVSSVPPSFERIVLRAMAKRADDRYPSMDALIEALVRWSEKHARASKPAVPWRAFAEERWAWTGVPAGVVAAFAFAWHASNLLAPASPQAASTGKWEIVDRELASRAEIAQARPVPVRAGLCEPAPTRGEARQQEEELSCSAADVGLTIKGDTQAYAAEPVRTRRVLERARNGSATATDKRREKLPPTLLGTEEIPNNPTRAAERPRVSARAGAIYLSDL